MSSTDSIRNNNDDVTCGFQISRTKRLLLATLQYFATPKFALAFLCLASTAEGFVVSGLYGVIVTTIEKRFHLNSTESGLIASSYDISACLSVLFITYIGGKGHKPVWIGWGVFLLGLGSIIFILPHFIAPTYEYGLEVHNGCNATILQDKCIGSSLRNYFYFFVVSMLFNGVGGTALFTLAITYLDENVDQIKSSLYHGIYSSSNIVGPALGFLLGGKFLTLYTNLFETTTIDDQSSLWVGAWWLGFIVGGVAILILAVPILLLPKQMPNTAHLRASKERGGTALQEDSGKKKIFHLLRSLAHNPTFILVNIALSFDYGLAVAVTTFGPKYLQSMFRLTPFEAAVYFGVLTIIAGATGQVLGGVIVSRFKLEVAGILKFCLACSVVALFSTSAFLKTCPDILFAGATANYSDAGYGTEFSSVDHNSPCNLPCNCNPDAYDPVCGEDGLTYYSPCFAGCISTDEGYSHCSCIFNSTSSSGSASTGKCSDESCGKDGIFIFLSIFFFTIFSTFLSNTPAVQTILRVVPFRQRSFALGVKFLVIRLLGSIPSPIIFGRVLDKACVVWSTECGKKGSCELYHNSNLGWNMAALIFSYKISVVLVFGAACCIYKQPPKQDTADCEENCHNTT